MKSSQNTAPPSLGSRRARWIGSKERPEGLLPERTSAGVFRELPALIAVAFLMFFLSPTLATAQGLIGGTIQNADSTIPTTADISIRIFPAENPTNLVAFPGTITYRPDASGAYVINFNDFPQALVVGQNLNIEVTNNTAGTSASLSVQILALEAAHVANVVLRVVPPASIQVNQIGAPTTVAQSQTGVPVTMTIENTGGKTGTVSGASLSFAQGVTTLSSEYTVRASGTNVVSLAAGATSVLTFAVDVGAAATLGNITIDGRLDQDNNGASNRAQWNVQAPADVRILSVTAPASVQQGQGSVAVSFTAQNVGGQTSPVSGGRLTFDLAGSDRAADYTVNPAVSNVTSLTPGQTATFRFTLAVSTSAQPGTVTVDGKLDQDANGADSRATWIAQESPIISVGAVTIPASVSQGQNDVTVTVRVDNVGGAGALLSGSRLTFTRGTTDQAIDYLSHPVSIPTTIGPNTTVNFVYRVDVVPTAATGAVEINGVIGQDADGLLTPPSWTVTRTNLSPVAHAGIDRTVLVDSAFVGLSVPLRGHDSTDPDRPTTDSAVPTLRFDWRLVTAIDANGSILASETPFSNGQTATLSGSGNAEIVDPPVFIKRPGTYFFGLRVTEVGATDPGNQGATSLEDTVRVVVVSVTAGINTAPAVEARIIDDSSSGLVTALPLVLTSGTASVRLAAVAPLARSIDLETPQEAIAFSWAQDTADPDAGPNPAVNLDNSSLNQPSYKIAAPGVYSFRVTAVDDGRSTQEGAPNSLNQRRSLPSNAVRVLARPQSNTFPILREPTAVTQTNDLVSFINPVVIAPLADIATGGFPVVFLRAEATDAETPSPALTFTWRQITGIDAAPAVVLHPISSGVVRFSPTASGLYRFEVAVSDGVLISRSRVIVPVDDLRPGGRVGVTPVINGQAPSGGTVSLGLFGPTQFGAVIALDAASSIDRSTLYGRAGSPLTFFWTQRGGPVELSFDSTKGTLVLQIPQATTGNFTFDLQIDNGSDAVQQTVQFSVASEFNLGGAAAKGGCAASGTGAGGRLLDLLVLLLPLGLVVMRGP